MIRSLYNLLQVNPGFTLQRVLTAQLPLPAYRVPDKKNQPAYYMEILRRIQTLPGVSSAGLATVLPLTGSEAVITISSDSEQEGVAFHSAFRAVSPDYFRAMQIPVVLGRIFTEADTADAQRVAVVNEALARQMWPGQNPIGKNIKWGKGLPVVGMVGNIKHKGLNAEPEPELYLPYMQYLGTPLSSLVVRTDADPVSMVSAMRRTIRDFEPDQPTMNVKTMEQVAYDSLAQPRFYSLLLGIFASLAVILATAGVYSVMSYSVSQQQHEIGVRMALGARISQIVAEFVGQGLRCVAIGIAVGIVGAMILTRLLSTMLFEIKPTDPATYVAVSFFLLTVAIVALLIPARCVTRVNPVVALRHE
jgi:predicted permease